MSQVEDARDWLSDAFPLVEDEESISDLSDHGVWRAIDSHYSGGIFQFARDGDVSPDTDGLPLGVAVQTDEGTFQISTRQDIRTLWHDVRGPDGEQWGSFDSLESAVEYITGNPDTETGDPVLGSCGCSDYHMADCHLMTGAL